MAEPLNPEGVGRFHRLLALIEKTNDSSAELTIWCSNGYAHLEVVSHNLPINEVRLAVGASPLEADEVSEIEERLAAAQRAFRKGEE